MNKNVPKLIIVRGASGSGKSTFVKKNFPTYNHFEADMYFVDNQGNYCFDSSKKKQAHEYCQIETLKSLQNCNNTVVSNTFIKTWEVDVYLKIAKQTNAKIEIYRLTTQFKNTHNVPEEIVNRMIANIEPIDGEIVI